MSSVGTQPSGNFQIIIPVCDSHPGRASVSTCFAADANDEWCLDSFCDICMYERSDICEMHSSLKRVSHLSCNDCLNGFYDDVKKGGLIPELIMEEVNKVDTYCAHIWPKVPCIEKSKEGVSEVTSKVSATFSLYLIFSIVVLTSNTL